MDEDSKGDPLPAPFYLRDPGHLYTLRSDEWHGWRTGVLRDGRQVLFGAGRTPVFGPDGTLLSAPPAPPGFRSAAVPPWADAAGFAERPISVRRFWLADVWCGIEDLDADHEMDEDDVQGWLDSGQFLFYCHTGDFILNRDGGVEAD